MHSENIDLTICKSYDSIFSCYIRFANQSNCSMKVSSRILPIIIISQFCCTSLWFASNGVMGSLIQDFELSSNAMGNLTSAVQFGFITGTLSFAFFTIADRFSPSKVFFVSAVLGSLANLGLIWSGNTIITLILSRFLTGFFLAGIYPVGMKIAADYYDIGLGKSLGYLVGALVLGTALPHLLKDVTSSIPWMYVIVSTSILAFLGGFLMLMFVPDGPHRKSSQQLDITAFSKIFRNQKVRSAAFGYFGHMWELYAFWAFVPIILNEYKEYHAEAEFNTSLWSFVIIGVGFLSCIQGGIFSLKVGAKKVAIFSLTASGVCCLLFPMLFLFVPQSIFLSFLLFWGMVVISDSLMFSTLVAKNAQIQLKGTALTLVNCIGFAITILSIQTLSILSNSFDSIWIYTVLFLGPVFGLYSLRKV